ncbi:MAG: hypothetical protein N3A58_01975 [Spirochaetes bacterium]|nr:hypothetical protein [Spirochaetota bacterium]
MQDNEGILKPGLRYRGVIKSKVDSNKYLVEIKGNNYIIDLPYNKLPGSSVLLKLISLNPKPIFEYSILENKIFNELVTFSKFLNDKKIDFYNLIEDLKFNDFIFELNEELNKIKENDKYNKYPSDNLLEEGNIVFLNIDENYIIPIKDESRKIIISIENKDKKGFSILFLLNEFYYCKIILSKDKSGFYNMNVKSNFKKYLKGLKEKYENNEFITLSYRDKIRVIFTYEEESFSYKI